MKDPNLHDWYKDETWCVCRKCGAVTQDHSIDDDVDVIQVDGIFRPARWNEDGMTCAEAVIYKITEE